MAMNKACACSWKGIVGSVSLSIRIGDGEKDSASCSPCEDKGLARIFCVRVDSISGDAGALGNETM